MADFMDRIVARTGTALRNAYRRYREARLETQARCNPPGGPTDRPLENPPVSEYADPEDVDNGFLSDPRDDTYDP